MKKFNVRYEELLIYFDQPIEAEDEQEARELFLKLLSEGRVDVNKVKEVAFEVNEAE